MDEVATWFDAELAQAWRLPAEQRAHEIFGLCQSYMERYPELAEPYLALAYLARQAQLPDASRRFLKQALQRSPFDPRLQRVYQSLKA